MAIVHIATDAQAGTANATTTDAIVTTGANFVVMGAGWWPGGTADVTPSDSPVNSWTALTKYVQTTARAVRGFYVPGPTTSGSHTFTVAGTSGYASVVASAFSGVLASPFASEAGNMLNGTSLQPGSVTPPEDGCLIVTGLVGDGSSPACSGGFAGNVSAVPPTGITGYAQAWMVQGTAAAISPAWTWTGAADAASFVAVFRPAPVATGQPAAARTRGVPHTSSRPLFGRGF